MFKIDFEELEGFLWWCCRGKNLIELPIGSWNRELISLMNFRRVAIAAPRQFAKSTYMAKFYPLYRALEDPGSLGMIVSSTVNLGMKHLAVIKQILERPEVKSIYGDQVTKDWRKEDIKLKNGSVIEAKGYTSQIRGDRYDYFVADDLEDDEIVENPERLKALEDTFYTTILQTLRPESGQAIVIGTILHPESFLMKLINDKREGWETRFYQAIMPNGDSLWPEKWPLKKLEEIRKEIGSLLFEQEYQNNPIPKEARRFKEEQFQFFDKEPACIYFTSVDPAIETGNVNDYSAIVTVGVDPDDNFYVVEVINKRMLPSELIDEIFNVHRRWNPLTIGIETIGYQKMLKLEVEQQRRNRKQYPIIRELKSGGRRKDIRIESLQPRFESGRIFIKRDQKELMTQLLRFPSLRCHDDIIDALSYVQEISHAPTKEQTKIDPDSFEAIFQSRKRKKVSHILGNNKLRRRGVGD